MQTLLAILGLAAGMGALAIQPAAAATIAVTNTNDAGPGSLRHAIASAAWGDTVDVQLSGCPCTITLTSGEIVIDKTLTLVGPGANMFTVSGNNASRIFRVESGVTVDISGVTLTHGNVNDDVGGAIVNAGALYVARSTIVASAAITSTVLTNGGGIYNGAVLVVTESTIAGNTAAYGGGIYNLGYLYVINSTISSNEAFAGGGGIYFSNAFGQATVYNSTIAANASTNGAPGIHLTQPNYNTYVRNTIVAGGNPGEINFSDVQGLFVSQGFNLIGVAEGNTGFTQATDLRGTSAAPLDPVLGPLQDNGGPTPTHALLPGSPAIDKGHFNIDPFTFNPIKHDQRGMPLPIDDPAIPNAAESMGEDIGAFELQIPGLDTTPPVITATISGTLGTNGWYTSAVQLSWSVVDDESAVTILNGCETLTIADDTGDIFLPCTASSEGGVSGQTAGFKRDATPPSLSPTVSPNPVVQNNAAAAAANASDDLSGVFSQSCQAVDTSTAGSHSVLCSATDYAGNTSSASATYQVVGNSFNFRGFFQPVDNLPTVNIATAGSAIPVKFSLTGYQGLGIFAAGYPASSPVQCETNEPGEVIEETATAGGSALTYTSASDQYSYVWATEKAWKGSCRILVVTFTDGTQRFAKFRLR
jgi:hypothetical protein